MTSNHSNTAGPPSKPINLTAVPASKSISISWAIKDQEVVHSYHLQYSYIIRECHNINSNMMNASLATLGTHYKLQDLEEDSRFNISLVAINPAGTSEEAIIMANTTQSGIYCCIIISFLNTDTLSSRNPVSYNHYYCNG